MQIELKSKSALRKEGNWQKMDITYAQDGETKKRTLVAIGKTKEVVIAINTEYNPGDIIDVEVEKSEDGKFWNWIGVTKSAATVAKTSYQAKSTYETPEERAKKQIYIVKQSSISNAIEYLNAQGQKFELEEVLACADVFLGYVFGTLPEEQKPAAAPAGKKRGGEVKPELDIESDDPF